MAKRNKSDAATDQDSQTPYIKMENDDAGQTLHRRLDSVDVTEGADGLFIGPSTARGVVRNFLFFSVCFGLSCRLPRPLLFSSRWRERARSTGDPNRSTPLDQPRLRPTGGVAGPVWS